MNDASMARRVIIAIVALLLLGALFIISGLVIVPYVVKHKLETVSNTNVTALSKIVYNLDMGGVSL